MALTVDGSGATAIATGTTSVAATITTTQSNDIILVLVHCETNSAFQTVSSVSGGGLTWVRRKQFEFHPGAFNTMEVWWAAASSALSAQTITVSFSAAIDDCALQLVAVNGVGSLTSPWDSNSALPATNFSAGGGFPSATISTTAASTMLIGFYGNGNNNTAQTAGSGFTLLYTILNGGGQNWSYTASEYRIFSSAQTSLSVAFGISTSLWGVIFDALSGVGQLSFVDLVGNLGGSSQYG